MTFNVTLTVKVDVILHRTVLSDMISAIT